MDQRQQMEAAHVQSLVETNVQLSYAMRNHLLRGRLFQFGKALDKAWQFKKQFSDKISSTRLDQIYAEARLHGAIGGKLLGAGGGGFFLFYAPPYQKHDLVTHLEGAGLKVRPFRFESQGMQAWSVRESKNHHENEIL